MKRFNLFLALFLFFAFAGKISAQETVPVTPSQSEEDCKCPELGKAPDFNLKDMEGNEVKLSDFAGKGVILFFWATWCQRCQVDIPDLNKALPLLKEKGVEFLSIGVGETQRKISRFTRSIPIDFPVLLDSAQNTAQAYVVVGVPTFVIINNKGRIAFQNHFWPSNYEEYLICK